MANRTPISERNDIAAKIAPQVNEAELNSVYEQIKGDARQRLGRLYNTADYPSEVRGLFQVAWDFPSFEPPDYLRSISPELYEEERRRVAARFDEAVRLAEQAFATEFAKLLSHLTERLTGGENVDIVGVKLVDRISDGVLVLGLKHPLGPRRIQGPR